MYISKLRNNKMLYVVLLIFFTFLASVNADSLVVKYDRNDYFHAKTHVQKREIKNGLNLVKVEKLHVASSITSRFAMTHVTSALTNQNAAAMEITFTMTLPSSAFISNFSMQISSRTIVGEVKEKEAAKKLYEAAKARNESAGHVAERVEDNPRETTVFDISANVGASERVTFNLTYQQLLSRSLGFYKHAVNIGTKQVVNDVQILVVVTEHNKIVKLHVPTFAAKISEKSNPDIFKLPAATNVDIQNQVDTADFSQVYILYKPTAVEQANGLNGQLVVLYDVDRTGKSNEIQVVNGYFVQFFAPSNLPAGSKHVVFVLDTSGSMSGTKMEQTKAAMQTILNELGTNDQFNIVTFSSSASKWKSASVAKTATNVKDAVAFVKSLQADGGTNMGDGLTTAMQLIHSGPKQTLGSMIMFLTDGQATEGITDETKLLAHIASINNDRVAIIHSISFGSGADYDLLQKISMTHQGVARKVYEDSDAAIQLKSFYAECSKLLLADVKITYLDESVKVSSLVQDTSYNYYEGSEIVIAGKVDSGSEIKAVVNGNGAQGAKQYQIISLPPGSDMFVSDKEPPYDVPCIDGFPPPFQPKAATNGGILPPDSVGGYVERAWAYLTIRKMLKDIKYKDMEEKQKKELKENALKLSLKYNFVTELTSLVVVQNNNTNDPLQSERNIEMMYDSMNKNYAASASAIRPMFSISALLLIIIFIA